MKLVSLELKKKDKKDTKDCCVTEAGDSPVYPWGSRLSFENEQISKIEGLSDVDVGDEVKIYAVATVISVRKESRKKSDGSSKDDHSVELQITGIAIEDDSEFEKSFDKASKD